MNRYWPSVQIYKFFKYVKVESLSKKWRSFHGSSSFQAKGTLIKMPSLSPTMVDGSIVKWLKAEGDPFQPGDILCDIQTDKAVVSLETDEEGVLAKILVQEDSKQIEVGTPIAVMVEEGEDWKEVEMPSEFSQSIDEKQMAKNQVSATKVSPTELSETEHFGPAARFLLSQYGLSSSQLPHSGPKGVLLKSDILNYVQSKNLNPKDFAKEIVKVPQNLSKPVKQIHESVTKKISTPVTPVHQTANSIDIEITPFRRTIAKRLTQAKSTAAHTYSTLDCNIDSLIQLKNKLNFDVKISVNDFVVKAVAETLKKCPEINCIKENNVFIHKPEVDISVAVATDRGLITPIVRNAHTLGLQQISQTTKELALAARSNSLKPEQYQGGTFTISNLGMFNIREFTSIINQPQCAILAVGSSRLQLDASGKNETRMSVTLSYDQEIIDDSSAAKFLSLLKNALEKPRTMLL